MDNPLRRHNHITKGVPVPEGADKSGGGLRYPRGRVRPGSRPGAEEENTKADTGLGGLGATHYAGPAFGIGAYSHEAGKQDLSPIFPWVGDEPPPLATRRGILEGGYAMDDSTVLKDLFGIDW